MTVLVGDCRAILPTLPDESVQCCVTSPPYWGLRDYGVEGQLGLERTPDEYVAAMVGVFREVKRVLRDDGTLWLNLGDSYVGGGRGGGAEDCKQRTNVGSLDAAPNVRVRGLKAKDLCGIPWRVAFALQADGWYLRSDIIWSKPNPMPESVTDRPTKAHEYLFLLSKDPSYYYDADAVAEAAIPDYAGRYAYRFGGVKAEGLTAAEAQGPGMRTHPLGDRQYSGKRNRRTVWTVPTTGFSGAHFATFPPKLIEPCILTGSRQGDTVLDPFSGAGTTGLVCDRLGRESILIELNPEYVKLAEGRRYDDAPLFYGEPA